MEVQISGNTYQTGRLSPFQQFHISRRLAPVFLALGSAAGVFIKGLSDVSKKDIMDAVGPLAEALSQLSDVESEYVLNTCLATVQRQTTGGWGRIMPSPGKFIYEDITMPVMLQLTFAVIKENLGNFMDGPQAT